MMSMTQASMTTKEKEEKKKKNLWKQYFHAPKLEILGTINKGTDC